MKMLLSILLLPTLAFGQMNLNNNTVSISSTGDIESNTIIFVGTKEDTAIVTDCLGTDLYAKILPKFVTGFGLTVNNGLTFAGDSITVITAGDYMVTCSYTFSGANSADWKIAVFKNSVKVYGTRRSSTTGNYSGGTTVCYLPSLVAGDDISVKVANFTAPGTADPTFSNVKFIMQRVP